MFVVLTAYAGSLTNDRGRFDFETFFNQQILEIPTDRPIKVCEKNCPILGKAYMFKEEFFERQELVCFVEQRDFDDPGMEDLINAENHYKFQGPVGPKACQRTAPRYAHAR